MCMAGYEMGETLWIKEPQVETLIFIFCRPDCVG
jgi:hypothetical protein